MFKNLLAVLVLIGAAATSQANDERTKSCMEPCASKADFPYFAGTSIGLDYGYDLAINKRVLRGDVDIQLSLVVNGVEEPMTQGARVMLSPRRELITLRTISLRYDENYARPANFDKKIELKISMVSGGRVLDSKIIPFAADDIADQVLVDEPRELSFNSEVSDASAKVVVELIAAGGMKCRWMLLPGALYCDPDVKRYNE